MPRTSHLMPPFDSPAPSCWDLPHCVKTCFENNYSAVCLWPSSRLLTPAPAQFAMSQYFTAFSNRQHATEGDFLYSCCWQLFLLWQHLCMCSLAVFGKQWLAHFLKKGSTAYPAVTSAAQETKRYRTFQDTWAIDSRGCPKETWRHAAVLASIPQSIPDSLTFHLICFLSWPWRHWTRMTIMVMKMYLFFGQLLF